MKRRRRCCVCGELFMPDARVGSRQRTCGGSTCRVERHRQACREWRERERPALEAHRLQARLGTPELRRDVVRDAMGLKAAVVLEEVFRLAVQGSRDAFASKQLELSGGSFRLVDRARQDATAPPGADP
jgi:hypothetical protein